MDDNILLNSKQPGFHPGDSSTHQLLAITSNSYKAFYTNLSLKIRDISLDLSKAFQIYWNERLVYKLKRLGISGKYSGRIHYF